MPVKVVEGLLGKPTEIGQVPTLWKCLVAVFSRARDFGMRFRMPFPNPRPLTSSVVPMLQLGVPENFPLITYLNLSKDLEM